MSPDVVLMMIVLGGIGLSAGYVRAEYRRWRGHGAAQQRREAALRELHTARLSAQKNALLPSVVELQGFSEEEAANPGGAANIGNRGAARTHSQRAYPFAERRKRTRQRAT